MNATSASSRTVPPLVARPGDELAADLDHQRDAIVEVDVGEVLQLGRRERRLRREEAAVQVLARLPLVEREQCRRVGRRHRSDEAGVAVGQDDAGRPLLAPVLETLFGHGNRPPANSSGGNRGVSASIWTPNVLSAIDTSVYWPTAKTMSINCSVLHRSESAAQVGLADERVAHQLVGRLEQQPVVSAPPGMIGSAGDTRDLVEGQAGAFGRSLRAGPTRSRLSHR